MGGLGFWRFMTGAFFVFAAGWTILGEHTNATACIGVAIGSLSMAEHREDRR